MSILSSTATGSFCKVTENDLEKYGYICFKRENYHSSYYKKDETRLSGIDDRKRIYVNGEGIPYITIGYYTIQIKNQIILKYAVRLLEGNFKKPDERRKLINKIKHLGLS